MSNHLSITGRLGQDPEVRFLDSGRALCNFTVAETPRRYNPDSKQWEDHGETLWLRCTAFGKQAEWFGDAAKKGSLVTLTGTLIARKWDKDGVPQTSIECRVDQLGIQTLGTNTPRQPAGDPWATQPQTGGTPSSVPAWDHEPPFQA